MLVIVWLKYGCYMYNVPNLSYLLVLHPVYHAFGIFASLWRLLRIRFVCYSIFYALWEVGNDANWEVYYGGIFWMNALKCTGYSLPCMYLERRHNFERGGLFHSGESAAPWWEVYGIVCAVRREISARFARSMGIPVCTLWTWKRFLQRLLGFTRSCDKLMRIFRSTCTNGGRRI